MTQQSMRSAYTWSFIFAVSFFAIILVHSSNALAATIDNWSDGSSLWSLAGNWTNSSSGHTVPAAGDTVEIIEIDSTNRTITYDYFGPAISLAGLAIMNQGSGTNILMMDLENLTTFGDELVGSIGSGAINQSGGINSLTGGSSNLYIGNNTQGGTGAYNLSAGTLSSAGSEHVLMGTFNHTGGTNTTSELDVGYTIGSIGTYNLNGPSTLTATTLNVGSGSIGTFNQLGGTDNVGTLSIGSSGGVGTYSLSGGTLNASTSVSVGGLGTETGVLNVSGTSTVADSGNLTVNSGSALYLSGGTLSVNNLIVTGQFNWTAGTLNINGLQTTTIGSGGPLGSNFMLGSGQTLNLFNSATVNAGSSLTINGGTLNAFSVINNGDLVMNSGALAISNLFNQAGSLLAVGPNALATVQSGISNAGEIKLGGGAASIYNSGGFSITNTGLIHGDGLITLNINNQSGGEIRAEDSKVLKFNGGGSNLGKINLQGGTLQFSSTLTNGSGTGQIVGRGTLIVGGTGLTNNGNMAFSAGISDVFGDVHDSTGSASQGITISGNSNVTFWDDVTNGTSPSDPTLFKVSSGSAATFFGTYSGNGVSGTGAVYYEADVSPGFSPASVHYGGDVTFDTTSQLKVELGGTTVGSQYDKVNVAGKLNLSGVLDVVLYNGFSPVAGNKFDILDWGTLSGTFASIVLPALTGSLEWNTSQLYSTGTLSIVNSNYLSGDFNRDGHVNAADILVAEQALANISSYKTAHSLTDPTLFNLVADVNGDGTFNSADLQSLLTNIKNGGGSADPVPEPSTFVLAALAFGMMCLRFRFKVGQSQRRLVPVAVPSTR